MMINIDIKNFACALATGDLKKTLALGCFCMRSWPGAHCTREFTNSLAAQRGEKASRHHAPQAATNWLSQELPPLNI
jgi:hypothetical protein